MIIAADLGQATQYLVDGAYRSDENIETAYGADIEVFCHGDEQQVQEEPIWAVSGVYPGVAPWRRRTASVGAEAVYCHRARRNV